MVPTVLKEREGLYERFIAFVASNFNLKTGEGKPGILTTDKLDVQTNGINIEVKHFDPKLLNKATPGDRDGFHLKLDGDLNDIGENDWWNHVTYTQSRFAPWRVVIVSGSKVCICSKPDHFAEFVVLKRTKSGYVFQLKG